MMCTALLVLALVFDGGALHPNSLLDLLSGLWAASQGDAGNHLDPDGAAATGDAGNHLDPDGAMATSDAGGYLDPNG